jgi:hypothetical protein
MQRRTKIVGGAVGVLAVVGGAQVANGCEPAPPDPEVAHCYDDNVEEVAVPGAIPWPSSAKVFPEPMTFEADGKTVFSSGSRTDVAAIKLRTPQVQPGSCFVGGLITSSMPLDAEWDIGHHNYGVVFQQSATLAHSRVENVGDGVDISAGELTVHDVDMLGVRDDCVQDDKMLEVTITDSYFECMVFASAWSGSDRDGSANSFTITNSMARLIPHENSYDPERFGPNQHGGFFKFQDGRHPRVVINDSWFMAQQPAAYAKNVNGGLSLPNNVECGSVTLVGTEAWPEREVQTWEDACDEVTYATTVEWEEKQQELLTD